MEKASIVIAIIMVNLVVAVLLVVFKGRKLRASGSAPAAQMSPNQRLMTGVMAFVSLVVFVVLITLYFVRPGGGAGG